MLKHPYNIHMELAYYVQTTVIQTQQVSQHWNKILEKKHLLVLKSNKLSFIVKHIYVKLLWYLRIMLLKNSF